MITLLLFVLNAHATELPYPEQPADGGAKYEVPVPDDLKPFASYPIKDVQTDEDRITYTLPLELTGKPNQIELHPVGNMPSYTMFAGPNGRANCDTTTCSVRYNNLQIDSSLVKQTLVKVGFSGMELDKRMEVARAFSGDPAGVIRFNAPAAK